MIIRAAVRLSVSLYALLCMLLAVITGEALEAVTGAFRGFVVAPVRGRAQEDGP